MKGINVMHSIVRYPVNFASGFARVLTTYMRWKKARSIFVGTCFVMCSQLQNETLFVGIHILVLSNALLPVCAKSIWLQILSKKRLEGGMNASSIQRYGFIPLDADSNAKRARQQYMQGKFATTQVSRPFTVDA
jgi:hypothetical protein